MSFIKNIFCINLFDRDVLALQNLQWKVVPAWSNSTAMLVVFGRCYNGCFKAMNQIIKLIYWNF